MSAFEIVRNGIIAFIIGFFLRKYTPNQRNEILGYKSPFYMNNKAAWYESNRFFGKLAMIFGPLSIPILMVSNYVLRDDIKNANRLSYYIYLSLILIVFIVTEVHLFILYKFKFRDSHSEK